jgi:hypothetical protein
MAVYTTFFIARPSELQSGFPGWQLPLPSPVQRELKNPFTRQVTVIETREPEWLDTDEALPIASYVGTAIEGPYEDYLEGRLSAFVRSKPHWSTKGLMTGEIGALASAMGLRPTLEFPLYCRPSIGAALVCLQSEMVEKLLNINNEDLERISVDWAATMSQPSHIHSVQGKRLVPAGLPSTRWDCFNPLLH